VRPAALALSFLPLQACANIAEHGVIGVVRSACWLRHLKTIKQDTLTHLCMLLCSLRNVFRREFITDFSRVEAVPGMYIANQVDEAAMGVSRDYTNFLQVRRNLSALYGFSVCISCRGWMRSGGVGCVARLDQSLAGASSVLHVLQAQGFVPRAYFMLLSCHLPWVDGNLDSPWPQMTHKPAWLSFFPADPHHPEWRRRLARARPALLLPLARVQHVQARGARRPVPPAPARPHQLVCAAG